jgi:RNA polymerase sigma-70 factor (ECF subfamily)
LSKEEEILNQIRQGNLEAFEVMFRTYYKELCNYVFQYFHDKNSAEEIVQDLFYKLWTKKDNLIIRTSIRAYLYKAAYNNTMLFLRENNTRKRIQLIPEEIDQNLVNEADIPIQSDELDQIIQDTIGSMPLKIRRVYELSRLEGLKYREIAEKLSISVKTVEANMGKALKLFRKNLKDYIEVI